MKTMHKLSAAALAVTSVLALPTGADQTSPDEDSMRDNAHGLAAIQNATVVTEPGEELSATQRSLLKTAK